MKTTILLSNLLLLLLFTGMITGCDTIFGTKGDKTTDEIFEEGRIDPQLIPDEIGYAALLPFWDFFDAPTDVFVGYDELVYVTDRSGLHVLDRAGRPYFEVLELDGAVAVTQDRDLNVYVAARYDTVVAAVNAGIDGWQINMGSESNIVVTEDPFDDVNNVLLTEIENYNQGETYQVFNLNSDFQEFEMDQGAEYEISFRILTENQAGSLEIFIDSGEPNYNRYWEESISVEPNDWETFTHTFTNNNGNANWGRIGVDFGITNNEGTVFYLDDVRLTKINGNSSQDPINYNGDFEQSEIGDSRPLVWNLPAVFKFRDINQGSPVPVDTIIHPFDDISQPISSVQNARLNKESTINDEYVAFTDITALEDNTIYITRRGPANLTGRAVAPDNIVMEFQQDPDRVEGKMRNNRLIRALSPVTPSLISSIGPSAITGFAAPPQRQNMTDDRSFLIAQADPDANIPFRVLWISAEFTPDGLQFSPRSELLARDTTQADRFLYDQHRFVEPSGIAYSADGRDHIFITDAATDSLYLFQSRGVEGVNPPPGADRTRPDIVSFGGTGAGPRQFNNPGGVAYFRQIVYVADTGNNRITRHKLNTDFERF